MKLRQIVEDDVRTPSEVVAKASEASRLVSKTIGLDIPPETFGADDPEEWSSLSDKERDAALQIAAEKLTDDAFSDLDSKFISRQLQLYLAKHFDDVVESLSNDASYLQDDAESRFDDPYQTTGKELRMLNNAREQYLRDNPEVLEEIVEEKLDDFEMDDPERRERLMQLNEAGDIRGIVEFLHDEDLFSGTFEEIHPEVVELLASSDQFREFTRQRLQKKGKLTGIDREYVEECIIQQQSPLSAGFDNHVRNSILTALRNAAGLAESRYRRIPPPIVEAAPLDPKDDEVLMDQYTKHLIYAALRKLRNMLMPMGLLKGGVTQKHQLAEPVAPAVGAFNRLRSAVRTRVKEDIQALKSGAVDPDHISKFWGFNVPTSYYDVQSGQYGRPHVSGTLDNMIRKIIERSQGQPLEAKIELLDELARDIRE